MALTLVVEDGTGLPDANSLNSLEEAEAYFAADLNGFAWDASDVDESKQSLVSGTRKMARAIDWGFPRATLTQALPWPFLIDGVAITPQVCKDAQLELSLWLREQKASNQASDGLLDDQTLKSLSVTGVVSLGFEGGENASLEIPNFILSMIRPFGRTPTKPSAKAKFNLLRVG